MAKQLRVLLVDDEAMLRMAIRLTLEDHGHTVSEAPDAVTGYDVATSTDFDVAVLDVNMPGDGLRLLDRLREERILESRILMLTADLSRRRTREHLEETGTPLLGKPFRFETLVGAIEAIGEGQPPEIPEIDVEVR